MNLVSTQNLKKTIQNEIDAYLEFSWDKKFSTVFPKEKSEARIKEIIKKAALSEEIIELLKKGINANYKFWSTEAVYINNLLDKDEFLKSAKDTLGLRNARERIVNFIVNSSAYSRMMSSIIYAAIKDFLAENPITKNNPVASSFIKIGQDFLNNLPGMQGNFDATITDFMRGSLKGRIQQSEKLIREEMDSGKNMDELLLEIWNFLGTIKLAEINSLLPENELINFLDRTPAFWEYLKQSGFAERIIIHQLNEFYLYFGDKTTESILKEVGIPREEISESLSEYLFHYLDNSEFREFFKVRLSKKYSDFYNSEAVIQIIP